MGSEETRDANLDQTRLPRTTPIGQTHSGLIVAAVLSNSLLNDQFACHRHENVVTIVHRLQAIRCELSFHRQRDEEFLPHESQAGLLDRFGVVKKLDLHIAPLPDPPGTAARLEAYRL